MFAVRSRWGAALVLLVTLSLVISACMPIQPLPAEPAPGDAPAAQAADPLVGAWEGAIQIAGVELGILLNVTIDSDGVYSATLDIPAQGATGLPVGNLQASGADLSFTILEGPQQATFTGTLEGDTLAGAFSQAGQEGTFTLARADATASAPAADSTDTATGISSVYTNTASTFSVPVPTNWSVAEENGIVSLTGPEGDLFVYLLAVPTDDVQAAITTAWQQIDPTFDLEIEQTVEPPAGAGYDQIVANVYKTGDDTHIVQAAGMLFNGTTFVTVYDLTLEAAQRRSSQLSIVDSGFKVVSMEEETVQAEEMAALTPELIAEWESFIEATMATFEVPGAVVGVVQGDELVYAQGFGFADAEQQTPITPETHMMIGSTSKSFATLMMAQLVDEGLMTWDTPARQLFPDFAVKDPALSETITMRNLVCACTGVPRRDLEFIFNFSELDADDVVASLREFEFFTDFGEAFQYSNQMVTTGGYIAGHVAEPEIADLTEAYNTALASRVTGPLGMANTTFSLDEVLARGDFATPHGLVLEGGVEPIPLAYEQSLDPIAPAGALWSTLDDMARYMVLQLNNGATPEGEQIVSAENLLVTRVPQVKISAEASYGLGWMIGSWRGLPMIEHGGNTLGFTSDFAFLPTADIGVIVMANAQAANVFTSAARMWLLHELFGVENKVQENVDFYRTQMDDAQARLDEQIGGGLDLVEVEPYVGLYTSPALGGLDLRLDEGRLIADFGEFAMELLPKVDDDGAPHGYMAADPPLPGLAIRLETDGDSPSVILGEGLTEYTFSPVAQ